MYSDDGGKLNFFDVDANSGRLVIDTSGNATFAGTVETTTLRTDVINNKANSANIIYRSGTSTLVGGGTTANKLYVLDNGRVGIGTDSPQQPLHVQSAGDLFTRYQANSNANGVQFQTWHGNSQTMTINSNTTNPFAVYVGSASGTIAINVDSNANVGIGTTSPGRGLTIDKSNANAALEIIKKNTTNQIVYLGTGSSGGTDDPLLRMFHNTTENIRLYTTGDSWINGGNVGIGTASPIGNLNINGGTGDTTAQDTTLSLTRTSSTSNVLAAKLVLTAPSTYQQNLVFRIKTTASSAENPSYYSDVMTLNYAGNVGIGTDSPGAKLEINNGSTQTELRISVTGDTGYSTINFSDASDINPGQIYYHHQQNLMNFRTNDNDRMVINSSGDVGIGTTNPQSKLHVNGGAIIGSTRFGDSATASIDTTGYIVANVPASTNGQSAIVEFVASGGGGAYYNVVYACYNGGGAWYYTKNVVGSGGNIEVAETNGSGSSTLVFYFRATSSSAAYTPRVMMRGTPYGLVTF
jgi:hypothetical protein